MKKNKFWTFAILPAETEYGICLSDRVISYQRCDESTKYDIHLSFSAVSSRLTHRKRLIQRALDSRDPGEPF